MEQGIGLIQITGPLLGGDEINEFRAAVSSCVERQQNKLVIDIAGVTYMNSAAVGVLVSTLVSYTQRNWQIKLYGIKKAVYSILAITKLNRVIESYETRDEAIRSFV